MRKLAALFLLPLVLTARADVAVLTQHNDNGRTGMNLNETVLNVTNVNTNSFGLVFTRAVDDQIYAQPLVMTNVNLGTNGTHNIVIVLTVNDSVYAFDADNPAVSLPYWKTNFLSSGIVAPRNTDMTGACGGNYKDFSGAFGIVGAPVIDPATQTLYLVARTKEPGPVYKQRLHALDLTTGAERPHSPVIISATCPSSASDSVGGVLTFDPYKHNQRPGLVLANGIVYITWASHCDWTPYHGWVIGYHTSDLTQPPVVYNTSAGSGGTQAGLWMSNQGPPADTNGNIFVSTGNGSFDGVKNFGESFLKLTPSGTNMNVASWFTPFNWSNLNSGDQDLGCGGMLLVPNTSLLLSGGKAGVLYLVNRDNMGGLTASTTTNNNIVQSWSIGSHPIHGGPIWWDGPNGSWAYIWGASSDHLKQFAFNKGTGLFNTTPIAQSGTTGGTGQPGGILSLSANGTNANTGIVWAAMNTTSDANQAVVAGTLHAYNAQNVATELWNSDKVSSRDTLGSFAKFVAPTVANGKVYMATFSGRLNVYGLLPQPSLTGTFSSSNLVISWPTNGFPGYRLQTNNSLAPGGWSNDTHSATTNNGNYQVTIPIAGNTTFYRLIR